MTDHDELACQDFVELVDDYLDGTLTEPARRRFEVHVAECPYCSTYLKQLRLTIRTVGRLAPPPPAPLAREELLRLCRQHRRDANVP